MVDYVTQARNFYAGLDPARQTQLWLGIVAAIATIVGLSWWMTNEPYADLIAGSEDEIGVAASALRDEGIPTRFDGLYLEVPEAQLGAAKGVLYDARIIDRAGPGVPMGAPPPVIERALLRQKQTDLAADIAGMPGVRSASVHIEPGQRALFLDDDQQSKAAVYLELHPSAAISDEQVKSIQALVAGGVGGMTPDYVSVSDSFGRLIAPGHGRSAQSSELLAQQDAYRDRIESSVEQALRRFVGVGAMTVAAMVEVDPVSRAATETTYDADKVWERKTRIDERKKEKTSADANGGPPGVTAELPTGAEPALGGGDKNSEESTKAETVNEAPSKREQTRQLAGQLTRASVAVALDETRLSELWGVEVGSEGWSAKLAQIETAGRTAMGFVETRGDDFSIAVMPFAPIETVEAPTVTMTGATAAVAPFVPYAIAFVALILAFMFVVRPLMAKVSSAPVRAAQMEIGPDGMPRLAGSSGPSEDDLAGRLHRLVEDFQPVDSDDLNTLVDTQADASAQVLRQWARDEG